MKRKNAGFTLIEVLVAIAVLGIIVVPICSSLVMSIKINTKAESLLQAQLDVSSAVETMMANGVSGANDNYKWYDEENNPYPAVTVKTVKATDENDTTVEFPYYIVTVTYTESGSNDPIVTVTTHIREAGGGGT